MNPVGIGQFVAANLAATGTDPHVWLALGWTALLSFAVLVFGVGTARLLGILRPGSPDAEKVGKGIAIGVLSVVSAWATLRSGGRSSFTPIAVALWVCVAATITILIRKRGRGPRAGGWRDVRSALMPVSPRTLVTGAVFLAAVGLLYAMTLAPRPRDGVQPTEFMDVAFYSVLGRDVAATGIEDAFSPSGYPNLAGMPTQTWYHWGELWLAGLVVQTTGVDPLLARHAIVLPILLLAACALSGTLVRKVARRESAALLLFGGVSCLLLAPIPVPENAFTAWASGLVVGISQFGLAAVSVLVLLTVAVEPGRVAYRVQTKPVVAVLFASLLPTHLVVASLVYVGCGLVAALQLLAVRLNGRRHRRLARQYRRAWATTVVLIAATASWGIATGHTIGPSGLSFGAEPFNDTWRTTVIACLLGFGAYYAIVAALPVALPRNRSMAALLVGALAVVAFGAIAWGARMADYNMFYFLFAGLAVVAAPVAAAALVFLWHWLRAGGRRFAALTLVVMTLLQIEVGIVGSAINLYKFGANDFPPIPTAILDAIRRTESGSRIGYSCQPADEISFWDSHLLSVDAHTGHRVVPLCYQLDSFAEATGGVVQRTSTSLLFDRSPQATLFFNADDRPSSREIRDFMRQFDIEYLLVDSRHPNVLGPYAEVVADSGRVQLLRVL